MCVCVALFVRMIPIRALRMCKTSSRQWGMKTCCCPKKRILVLWISGCLGQRHQQWSSYQSVSALRTRDKHLATCKKRISSPTRGPLFLTKEFQKSDFQRQICIISSGDLLEDDTRRKFAMQKQKFFENKATTCCNGLIHFGWFSKYPTSWFSNDNFTQFLLPKVLLQV